jgi:hypothetical protein
MPRTSNLHIVYRSINKPLTIWGVERRLGSLIGGIFMFSSLYLLARWTTASDPQLLRILLNSSKFKTRYDPAKHEVFDIRRILKHDKTDARS